MCWKVLKRMTLEHIDSFFFQIWNSVAATGSEVSIGNDVICPSSARPSLSWSIRRWKCVTDPQSVPLHVFSQLHGFLSGVILETGSHQAEQTFCKLSMSCWFQLDWSEQTLGQKPCRVVCQTKTLPLRRLQMNHSSPDVDKWRKTEGLTHIAL